MPPTPAHAGTKQRIVEAIATIVLDGGVEAVTHREIAKRAVVSLSSLTHHFGSRTELVRAGMHYLLMRSDSDPRSVILPYELALQALSDPFLAPLASAVRLQMGASAHAAQNYVDGITGRARAEMTALTDCAAALVGEVEQA